MLLIIHCLQMSWHHDDVIKWKHFPRYWPFVRGIHREPVNSPHKASDAELSCFLWSTPNKPLSKQSWGWWFETLSRPLWRHCNDTANLYLVITVSVDHPSLNDARPSTDTASDYQFRHGFFIFCSVINYFEFVFGNQSFSLQWLTRSHEISRHFDLEICRNYCQYRHGTSARNTCHVFFQYGSCSSAVIKSAPYYWLNA